MDTDVWVAALLMYAVYPWTRNVRVVVRKQSTINAEVRVTCVDVLQLFNVLTAYSSWPSSFNNLHKCLPVIAAYMLCGTDFTPTFFGLTSFFMYQTYFELAKNPENHRFIKPLGNTREEEGRVTGLALEVEECAKFVALAYYNKNKSMFTPNPGHQVDEFVAPSARNGQVDDTKDWIKAIHERTSVKWYGEGEIRRAAPNYDVIELCVFRMSWLVEYWLAVVPVGRTFQEVSSGYPIEVPDWTNSGYLPNSSVEGGCMMLLRRVPKVTIWPGGSETMKCRCSSTAGKGQCRDCVCMVKGYKQCSELCGCKLACLNHGTDGRDMMYTYEGEADSSTDEEGVDDGEALPGIGGVGRVVGFGGFAEEDEAEYESLRQHTGERALHEGVWYGMDAGVDVGPPHNEMSV